MFEREAASEAVRQLLRGASLAEGGALFIIGESGLGKTSVLDLARRLGPSEALVGRGQGDPMEAALPFGLMGQAIDDLGGRRAVEAAPWSTSPDEARTSRFYRTLRWLEELAAGRPVVLLLDDLHWSDGDSLALLSYICRRTGGTRIAVVCALRPWPPTAESLCLRLAAAGHARLERLAPLSDQAAQALLGERLGHPVPDDVLEQACLSSAGNPLLLEQAALALRRDGVSVEAIGSWRAGDDRLFLQRFGDLAGADLRLARSAGVLGRRFRPELAVELAGLDEDEAARALEALSRSGLVRHVGVGVAEFTHMLFQQALCDDLEPLVREELHARAFRLLLERGMEPEAAEHAVRGNLVGHSEAIGVLVRAGRAALRAGAMTTALERLEAAERLSRSLLSKADMTGREPSSRRRRGGGAGGSPC